MIQTQCNQIRHLVSQSPLHVYAPLLTVHKSLITLHAMQNHLLPSLHLHVFATHLIGLAEVGTKQYNFATVHLQSRYPTFFLINQYVAMAYSLITAISKVSLKNVQNSPSIVTTYQMYGREEFHVRNLLCLTWEICTGHVPSKNCMLS